LAFEDKKAISYPTGTLLVTCIGEIGKLGITNKICSSNQQITAIKPKDNVNVNYLFYWFKKHKKQLQDLANNAVVPILNNRNLGKVEVAFPLLEDQKKIAEILDAADSLRQKDKQLVEHYDRLSQSLFLDMFGVPNNNIYDFEIGTIRDLVNTVNYGTSAKAQMEGEYTYLRMNNITYQGYMNFESLKFIDLSEKDQDKYLVKKGDILFNRTNSKELVGKTGLFDKDISMAIAGYLIRVRANEKANPYYLWRFMNSNYCKKVLAHMCKSIVGMANINAQELQNIKVLIPPIELQNQFEKTIKEIENQKTLAQQALLKSEDLFNSLLQKAFKGELTNR
jgi:type I restriction enzyme S subunit